MYCTRIIEFDSAHRILEHESKCQYFHGHRYKLEIGIYGDDLDSLGRVIDFGVISKKIGGWIDHNWDHNTILNIQDKEFGESIKKHSNKEPYYIPCNPTAENMLLYLGDKIIPSILENLTSLFLRLWETPNCYVKKIFHYNSHE